MQPQTNHSTRRFFLHYVEMVAVMFIAHVRPDEAGRLAIQRARREHV